MHQNQPKMFVHEHEDHMHAHEHYHGEADNIIITTIGLVIHSIADGLALGASLFCKYNINVMFYVSEQQNRRSRRTWSVDIHSYINA
jgi:zinc transporter ZupT